MEAETNFEDHRYVYLVWHLYAYATNPSDFSIHATVESATQVRDAMLKKLKAKEVEHEEYGDFPSRFWSTTWSTDNYDGTRQKNQGEWIEIHEMPLEGWSRRSQDGTVTSYKPLPWHELLRDCDRAGCECDADTRLSIDTLTQALSGVETMRSLAESNPFAEPAYRQGLTDASDLMASIRDELLIGKEKRRGSEVETLILDQTMRIQALKDAFSDKINALDQISSFIDEGSLGLEQYRELSDLITKIARLNEHVARI